MQKISVQSSKYVLRRGIDVVSVRVCSIVRLLVVIELRLRRSEKRAARLSCVCMSSLHISSP